MVRAVRPLVRTATALLLVAALATGAGAEPVRVKLDQATIVRLPERIGTLVIGNPMIADATVQPGGLLVVTGRGYGTTNLIGLDQRGNVVLERLVQVAGPSDAMVTVFRGMERESFTCNPRCERAIVLGDTPSHFDTAITQTGNRAVQAAGQPGR